MSYRERATRNVRRIFYRRRTAYIAVGVILAAILLGLGIGRGCGASVFIPNAPITVAPTLTPTETTRPTLPPTPTLTFTPTAQEILTPTVLNPLPIPDTATPTSTRTLTPTVAPSLTNSPSITPRPTLPTIPSGRTTLPNTGASRDDLQRWTHRGAK